MYCIILYICRIQVVHESWSTAVAHYHTQRRAYLKSWQQHRAELQDKVAAINGAAWEAHTMEEGVRRGREEQQRSCRELLEKVCVCIIIIELFVSYMYVHKL